MPKFNQQKLNRLKLVDKLFKSIYFGPRNKKKYQAIQKDEIKSIIVIGFLLIGDTVMYIPALNILKKNYPNAKITLVCGGIVKSILISQSLVDDFIVVNCPWISPFDKSVKNIVNFFSSLKIVNKKRYDIAIDFRGDWRNIFYMNFINSTRKISFDFSGGTYMLTDPISVERNIEHLIDETIELLTRIDCVIEDSDKYPKLELTVDDKAYLENFEKEFDLAEKVVVGIHPGASLEERKWKDEKYAETIIRLTKDIKNIFFILFEGPNEHESIERIIGCFVNERVDYLVINKSIREYLVLLNSCKLIICNDSGAAHLAAAFNIPEIVIFGKGDPIEVKPFSRNISKIVSYSLECKPCHLINCKFGTNLCMNMVTVDDVYLHASEILKPYYK
jgi:ADP-heptose:LPS heptosyltransferase